MVLLRFRHAELTCFTSQCTSENHLPAVPVPLFRQRACAPAPSPSCNVNRFDGGAASEHGPAMLPSMCLCAAFCCRHRADTRLHCLRPHAVIPVAVLQQCGGLISPGGCRGPTCAGGCSMDQCQAPLSLTARSLLLLSSHVCATIDRFSRAHHAFAALCRTSNGPTQRARPAPSAIVETLITGVKCLSVLETCCCLECHESPLGDLYIKAARISGHHVASSTGRQCAAAPINPDPAPVGPSKWVSVSQSRLRSTLPAELSYEFK